MNHIQAKKAYNELLNILYVLENQNLLMTEDQLIDSTTWTVDAVISCVIKKMEWENTDEVFDIVLDGIRGQLPFDLVEDEVVKLSGGIKHYVLDEESGEQVIYGTAYVWDEEE